MCEINNKWLGWYKKIIKIWILQRQAFDLAFLTFVGLLYSFWNPWHLKSLVVGKNVKYEYYNPKNNSKPDLAF